MGLLIYLIIIWGLWYAVTQLLVGKRRKQRSQLRIIRAHTRDRLRWDSDVMRESDITALQTIGARCTEILKTPVSFEETGQFIKQTMSGLGGLGQRLPHQGLRDILELLVVVFGVVGGARALYLQPFQIPTGSMQPTLNGINFIANPDGETPGKIQRFFNYLNYGYTYGEAKVAEHGYLEPGEYYTTYPLKSVNRFMFPKTRMKVGSQWYTLPGKPRPAGIELAKGTREYGQRYVMKYHTDNYPDSPSGYYNAGDYLARGNLQQGDHLFVNRVAFNFFEPKRGDITVFQTHGIKRKRGKWAGRYYIKRLVGIPGDTLKIMDNQLYVQPKGETEFRPLDGSFHPDFPKIYSGKGGYCGHVSIPGAEMLSEDQEITLPPDQYFMLGDNTHSSEDSRYWGFVPRKNIIGRASIVYWPFTRRAGFAGHAEPLDEQSKCRKR